MDLCSSRRSVGPWSTAAVFLLSLSWPMTGVMVETIKVMVEEEEEEKSGGRARTRKRVGNGCLTAFIPAWATFYYDAYASDIYIERDT